MALKKTGYTSTTSKNYLINAATVYTGVKYEAEGGFSGTLHGATSGGVTLTVEQNYRDIEVDGTSHMKVKGNKVLESANATLTANMKEITAETIRQSLNGVITDAEETDGPTGYKVIRTKRYIDDGDYLDNIAVVGTLSGTNEPVIAILDNAISTGGLELSTEDNNEAVVEQTYEAHASVEQLDADEFPWKILFPSDQTVSVTPASISLSLLGTETQQLDASTSPAGVAVTYESNDKTVATVSSGGLITAVKEGTAIITAKTSGGASDTCLVTVTA